MGGEVIHVDFGSGKREHEANRYSDNDRINAAATAIAQTDEVERVLNEGVHLNVDLGELYASEEEALSALTDEEKIEAVQLAREALF